MSPDHVVFLADGLGQYAGAANTAGPGRTGFGFYTSGAWIDVPPSYARPGHRPMTLLVWLHGCTGSAYYDASLLSSVYSRDRGYIIAALNGPEDGNRRPGAPSCWNPFTDVAKVMRDVAVLRTHLAVDPRRIFVGGYSSGGDVAWQTIFTHARTFAGILAFNTNPVRDNAFGRRWGLSAIGHAIAAASWRFHVVQISHDHDHAYRPGRCGYPGYPVCAVDASYHARQDAGVTPAIRALVRAGFPVIYRILPGHHYDADRPSGCESVRPASCRTGTYHDIAHDLLPYLRRRAWEAPAR